MTEPGQQPDAIPPEAALPEAAPPDARPLTAPEQGPGHPGPGAAGTGHPAVDAALEALEDTRGLPPGEQIPGYDAVHRRLQETLATIDEGQN